jgi:hypothetical protein
LAPTRLSQASCIHRARRLGQVQPDGKGSASSAPTGRTSEHPSAPPFVESQVAVELDRFRSQHVCQVRTDRKKSRIRASNKCNIVACSATSIGGEPNDLDPPARRDQRRWHSQLLAQPSDGPFAGQIRVCALPLADQVIVKDAVTQRLGPTHANSSWPGSRQRPFLAAAESRYRGFAVGVLFPHDRCPSRSGPRSQDRRPSQPPIIFWARSMRARRPSWNVLSCFRVSMCWEIAERITSDTG